jgi:YggT family protein
VQEVLCYLLTAYLLVMFARMIFSWIPPTSGGLMTVQRVLADLTEPVLAPVRRVIPPAGVLDLSFLVVVILLGILRNVVCGG